MLDLRKDVKRKYLKYWCLINLLQISFHLSIIDSEYFIIDALVTVDLEYWMTLLVMCV